MSQSVIDIASTASDMEEDVPDVVHITSPGTTGKMNPFFEEIKDFNPPENDEVVEGPRVVHNKKMYKLKNHPLMFTSILHLSCFKQDNFPLYCRFSKDENGNFEKYGRSVEDKGKTARLNCKGKKIPMIEFKAYLMDLYNKKRLFISKNENYNDGENHYYLHFTKDCNGKEYETFELQGPPDLYKTDKNNTLRKKAMLMKATTYLLQKKNFSIEDLRNNFYSPYDYMEYKPNGEYENRTSILSLFFDVEDTDLENYYPTVEKKGNKRKRTTVDSSYERMNIDSSEKPKELDSFDINTINSIINENFNLKIKISSLENKMFENMEAFEDFKSSALESIDDLTNQLKRVKDTYHSDMKKLRARPSYADVAAKANSSSSKENAIVEHRRRTEKLIQEENEKTKKKLQSIEEDLMKTKEKWPEEIKAIISSEGGMEKIQKAVLSLTTRATKRIRSTHLMPIYIMGIERQPIRLLRETLYSLGIKKKPLKNISFIGKNITEMIILKVYKTKFLEIMCNFPNQITFLENFDPRKPQSENPTLEEIHGVEVSFYNRVEGIIRRKKVPDYLKDFFMEVLKETDFKTINGDGETLPGYLEATKDTTKMMIDENTTAPTITPGKEISTSGNISAENVIDINENNSTQENDINTDFNIENNQEVAFSPENNLNKEIIYVEASQKMASSPNPFLPENLTTSPNPPGTLSGINPEDPISPFNNDYNNNINENNNNEALLPVNNPNKEIIFVEASQKMASSPNPSLPENLTTCPNPLGTPSGINFENPFSLFGHNNNNNNNNNNNENNNNNNNINEVERVYVNAGKNNNTQILRIPIKSKSGITKKKNNNEVSLSKLSEFVYENMDKNILENNKTNNILDFVTSTKAFKNKDIKERSSRNMDDDVVNISSSSTTDYPSDDSADLLSSPIYNRINREPQSPPSSPDYISETQSFPSSPTPAIAKENLHKYTFNE